MHFEKIADKEAIKLEGRGRLHYQVWEDQSRAQYVQIVGNDEDGTFSRLLFSVDSYRPLRMQRAALTDLQGVNLQTGNLETISDNNVGAFLKAVLKDLLDEPDLLQFSQP